MALVHAKSMSLESSSTHVQVACNGLYVASPHGGRTVVVWSLEDISEEVLELQGHSRPVTAVSFGRGSLLCSCADDCIILWNIDQAWNTQKQGGRVKGRVVGQDLGAVQYCSFNKDCSLIALCVGKEVVAIGAEVEGYDCTLEGHMARVNCAEFCQDRPFMLVTASDDRTFKVWNISTSELIYQSSVISASPFLCMAMSPSAPHVALGTDDGIVRVYDLEDNGQVRLLSSLDCKKVSSKFEGHENKTETLSRGFKKISSLPSWKTHSMSCSQDHEDPPRGQMEMGSSVLALYFAVPGSFADEETGEGDAAPYPTSVITDLVKSTLNLVIGTTGAIILSNAKTTEAVSYFDLQDPVQSIAMQKDKEISLSLADTFAFSQPDSNPYVWCCIRSLFGKTLDILQLKPSLTSSLVGVSAHSESVVSHYVHHDATQTELTVLSSAPLCLKSPLRAEYTERELGSAKPNVTVGLNAKGRSFKKPAGQNPFIFHDKIKSSGYGSPKTRPAVMFQPKTNIKKKTPSMKSPVKPRKLEQSLGAAMMREYPINSDPPTELVHKTEVAERSTSIRCIRISGNGKALACGLANKTAQVLALPLDGTSMDKGFHCSGHNGAVSSVSWSHDSKWLLTGSVDKTVKIWCSSYSEPVLTIDSVKQKLTPDGIGTKAAKGYSTQFDKEIKHVQFYYMNKFVILTHGNAFHMLKYHLDTSKDEMKRYVCNSRYKLVKSFEMANTQQITAFSAVNSFYSYIAMCTGSNRAVEVFDMNVGKSVQVLGDVHTRPAHALCQNQGSAFVSHPPENYDLFLTTAVTDGVKLWDLRTSKCVCKYEGHKNRSHACGVAFSPCSRFIAAGSEDKSAYIYDIRTGTYLHKLSGHTDVVSEVAYHPLYCQLLTVSLDGKLSQFDAK
ncbi:PREDICTED: WD repeat-containing protein 27-like [Priapulus caudatus]|uniref:WD repeat-containing protein 27-like n=1 Tax=Priapulus caudatus TaxID=37621 RepID=A0ABM1EHT2_PRICU|nr:PREDICTED: WD repeat-containing protein 27-like [Priapulus caudatus]